MRRFAPVSLRLTLVALAALNCGEPTSTVALPEVSRTPAPPPPPPAPSGSVVASLHAQTDTGGAFVGMRRVISVLAFDQTRNRVSAGEAEVSISNASAITVEQVTKVPVIVAGTGRMITELQMSIQLIREGTTVIRFALGTASDSVVLHIKGTPPPTKALVVDSFTVIEYRERCAWDCPYLVYAPVLKLREPTGGTFATVEGVEFTIPGMSTGMCRGTATYLPGQTHHLNYIDPYLWSNDLILVRLDGTPVPDGPATARVLVRDSQGHFGIVEASAPIQRMVKSPTLPAPPSGWSSAWMCNVGN